MEASTFEFGNFDDDWVYNTWVVNEVTSAFGIPTSTVLVAMSRLGDFSDFPSALLISGEVEGNKDGWYYRWMEFDAGSSIGPAFDLDFREGEREITPPKDPYDSLRDACGDACD